MTVTKNGNGSKWAATVLAAIVLSIATTGAMSYAAFWKDTCSRTEISKMISTESPYVQDRAMILAALERIEELLREQR